MSQVDHHMMVHVKDYPSGEEEWYCPQCGRRFLMQWPPEYKRTILVPGDEFVTHGAGKGGVSIQPPEVIVKYETDSTDEPHLAIWEEWLDQIGFENW